MDKTIEERVSALEAAVAALRPQPAVNLDSDRYADFLVKRSPPRWLSSGGADYAGQPISTTTPEFCDAIASYLDWTAQKDEEKNHSYVNAKGDTVFPAKFARKDAARARAWSVKLRSAPVSSRPPGRRPSANDGYDDLGQDEFPLPF